MLETNHQRTNRRAFDRRVSLVLKKCVESLDRSKLGQKKPVNWALLELIQMRNKESKSVGRSGTPVSNRTSSQEVLLGPRRYRGPETYEGEKQTTTSNINPKIRCENIIELQRQPLPNKGGPCLRQREQYSPSSSAETNADAANLKKKGSADFLNGANNSNNNNHKKTTERTDLFVSDISRKPEERPKKINLHTSNIRKWSNAVETMRTLRRYIKNEVTESNELLIGYMLSIDFALLQSMYKYIRAMLPGTSEIAELDGQTKDKILIAMDAIELWDKKRKKLSVPDFVNNLFGQVSSIEGFIKKFWGKTSEDSNVEPVLLSLMAHAFGLRIESEWKVDRMRPKYRPKTIRIS